MSNAIIETPNSTDEVNNILLNILHCSLKLIWEQRNFIFMNLLPVIFSSCTANRSVVVEVAMCVSYCTIQHSIQNYFLELFILSNFEMKFISAKLHVRTSPLIYVSKGNRYLRQSGCFFSRFGVFEKSRK